jgi:hypothetical protein
MSPTDRKWKASRDALYRGDVRDAPGEPTPDADTSIVRHILYLGGAGRESPYLSLTEDEWVAQRFAGKDGKVYASSAPILKQHEVGHLTRRELTQWLKGTGKGRAEWPNAFEVLRARQYVEENAEHLADFSGFDSKAGADLHALVASVLR